MIKLNAKCNIYERVPTFALWRHLYFSQNAVFDYVMTARGCVRCFIARAESSWPINNLY